MAPARENSINNNKALHVLHIASGDLWAGAEVMLYTLAKTMHEKSGTKVTVITLNHGALSQKLTDCGISVHVVDESKLNAVQILRQITSIVTATKPDVIHTHRLKENILGTIAAWLRNIPSIRTTHGAPEHRPPLYKIPKRIILYIDQFCGRFYQRYVIAVSSDLAKKLESDFPAAKIKTIENGIDIESLISSVPENKPENTKKEHYRIGIAGRLVPVKRVDMFIQAAVYFKQHDPLLPVHFHIYGDGPMLDTLRAQVLSQNAENYIHFEGHCENIAAELQMLDALMMTSDHEGLPMVLLEAMCMRTPIIAHAVGGIPNLLDHGKCGTLITNHKPAAFARAVLDLINQPEHYQDLASLAFERLKKYYSAKHTAAAYLAIYKQIAG